LVSWLSRVRLLSPSIAAHAMPGFFDGDACGAFAVAVPVAVSVDVSAAGQG